MAAAIFPAYALARTVVRGPGRSSPRSRRCRARALVRADPRGRAARVSGGSAGVRCSWRGLSPGPAGGRSPAAAGGVPARGGAALATRRALRRARALAARAGVAQRADEPLAQLLERWDWAGPRARARCGVPRVRLAEHRLARMGADDGLLQGAPLEYGLWAAGAFAIGVGILPADRGARLARSAATGVARPTTAGLRRIVAAAPFVSLGFYAAVKGAYLSTTFSSLVVERNLIYLTPLVFVGTALLLERLDTPWWAAVPASARALGRRRRRRRRSISTRTTRRTASRSWRLRTGPGSGRAADRDGDRRRRRLLATAVWSRSASCARAARAPARGASSASRRWCWPGT